MIHDAIGLDIGGANIKAATASGQAWIRPFELWRDPERLTTQLAQLRAEWGESPIVAITMTGELCDCFHTKQDGVTHILAAVEEAFAGSQIRVWTTAGTFLTPDDARHAVLDVAAANWLATATLAARLRPNARGIFLDTGSTTTDVIPFAHGQPMPNERTDMGRMQSHELVYTGAKRTPVCALLGATVAAEWFATTHDVYVRLGLLPEEPTNHDTADRRAMTMAHAHARLSRMVGGDPMLTRWETTQNLAQDAYLQQQLMIAEALWRVVVRLPGPPTTVVIAGSGEFLAQAAWHTFVTRYSLPTTVEVLHLSQQWSPVLSDVAAAYAVARLASSA